MECHDLHLVNRVTPKGQVMDAARELAETIAAAAPLSVQAEKQMVNLVGDLTPEEADKLEKAGALTAKARVYESSDSKEGARAFVEKRKPVWTGR